MVSVANLTRGTARVLSGGRPVGIHTETHAYPLEQANQALDDLRNGRFRVLRCWCLTRDAPGRKALAWCGERQDRIGDGAVTLQTANAK